MKYFILAFLFSNYGFSQLNIENDSIIIWNINRNISWEDFSIDLEKDFDSKLHAGVGSNILILSKGVKRCGDLKFIAIFDKKKSWVAFKSKNLLKHEKLHFDITELYARKLRKYFAKEENYDLNDSFTCQNVVYSFLDDLRDLQHLYDEETKHGIIAIKQDEWNKKIKDMLEDYKEYELEIEIDEID
jgi:hypothetical protein